MQYMVQDPVCGKSMDWQQSLVLSYQGRLFYFCCKGCLGRFRHAPRRFCSRACCQAEALCS